MNGTQTVETENVRAVRSSIEAYNIHDIGRATEYEGESIVQYWPYSLRAVVGRDASRQSKVDDFTAFPDIQFKIDRIFGQGDWVSVEGTVTGTNTGRLRGKKDRMVKATQNRISIPHAQFHRLKEGKIVETHSYWDTRQVQAQLGLLRKNVTRNLLVIAIGLSFMVIQAAILTYPSLYYGYLDTWLQFSYVMLGAVPVILGVASLGRTLLELGRIS